MSHFSRCLLGFALLLVQYAGTARAQESEVFAGQRLRFTLPAGWTPSFQADEKEFVNGLPRAKPGDVTLVFRAASADSSTLSIISDRTPSPWNMGPNWPPSVLHRLEERVASCGLTPLKIDIRYGRESALEGVVVSITAGAPGQKGRIFHLVAFSEPMKPLLACYLECDEGNAFADTAFDSWIASIKVAGSGIGATLAQATPVTPNLPAVADVTTPAVPGISSSTPDPGFTGTASEIPGISDPAAGYSVSAETGSLVQKIRSDLVLITGGKGKGSGFVINLADGPNLITNIHVLADNPNPIFTTLPGVAIPLGPAFAAVGHDICKIKIAPAPGALEVLTNLDATVRVGDAVVVPGNAEGADVVKPWEGKVVGLGPNLVEVDAPFIPGNSGSPIIHVKTGKVIGVATYLTIKKLDNRPGDTGDSDKSGEPDNRGNNSSSATRTEIRRFGYRIDSVKTWEPINWRRFNSQATQLSKIEETSHDFIQLFDDSRNHRVNSQNYSTPAIRRALQNFAERRKNGGNMSNADADMTHRSLMGDLRTATRNDIAAFDAFNAYDYFRRAVADEAKFRDELYNSFSRQMW